MIQLNDFPAQWRAIEDEALAAFRRVGASGWYVLGAEVREFEAQLAAWWGLGHAVGVGNGLDAIEIGLRALGLAPGERVLTTPLSAFATTLAIVRAGGVPVFVDVDESGLIDLEACRAVLASAPPIRFLVPVHLFGACVDLAQLLRLKSDFDLRLVEDCAQSIGASFAGRSCGTVGQIAATSFYPTKNLGALGDGGALLTGDGELAAAARALRHYGQSATYVHDLLGLNSRLDELQAAILRSALLPRLDEWTRSRRRAALEYCERIRNPRIQVLGSLFAAGCCWHLFPVLVDPAAREGFRRHLAEQGVQTGIHYPAVIPDQRALAGVPYEVVGDLVRARLLAASEVSLPAHPFLSEADVEAVIAVCNAWEG